MKKILIILLFSIALTSSIQAQRLLPQPKGVFVSTGMPLGDKTKLDKEHFTLSLGLTYNASNSNYWIFGANYIRKGYTYRKQIIPLENLFLESGYMLNILSDSGKNILLNAGLSGIIGYEIVNESEQILHDGATLLDNDNFIYGIGGQVALEGFLTDNLMLFSKIGTAIIWGSDVSKYRPQANIGIRVLF